MDIINKIFLCLKDNNIHISKSVFAEKANLHQSYSSLLSYLDVLSLFCIQYKANYVSYQEIRSLKINKLLLYCIKNNGQEEIFYIKNNYQFKENEKKIEAADKIIIIAFNKGKHYDYIVKNRTNKIDKTILWICFLSALMVPYSAAVNYNVEKITLFITVLLGVIFSLASLFYKSGNDNIITNKLCSSKKDINACHYTIKRDRYRISEIALTYFAFQFIILYCLSIENQKNIYFEIFNRLTIIGILVAIASFSLQIFKYRKICKICALISALLITQNLIMYENISKQYDILLYENAYKIIMLLFLFVVLFILIINISNKLKLFNIEKRNRNKDLRIKYNPIVFNSLLQSSKKINLPLNENIVVLGAINSNVNIELYLDLNCNSCQKIFNQSIDLFLLYEESFLLKLNIFSSKNKSYYDKFIAKITDEIKHNINDVFYLKESINKIFEKVLFEKNNEIESKNEKNNFEINETSNETIVLFNNYSLPEEYEIQELKFVLMQY